MKILKNNSKGEISNTKTLASGICNCYFKAALSSIH